MLCMGKDSKLPFNEYTECSPFFMMISDLNLFFVVRESQEHRQRRLPSCAYTAKKTEGESKSLRIS